MTTVRVIPCLDTADGRVVKGVRFAQLRDAGDPVERALAYEAQGADEIVLLDVSATPEGRRHALDTVRGVRAVLSIPLTVGGGVRSVDDAARLLEAGADKVSVNTAAVRSPALLTAIATRFGAQCAVVAIDAARVPGEGPSPSTSLGAGKLGPYGLENAADIGWRVVVRSGGERTAIDAVQWAADAVQAGAGEVLLTSVDRDGTRAGYDVELLRAVAERVRVPIVASGGADSPLHLLDAIRAGASAVLAASIFHDGDQTVATVKQFLSQHGVEVRL